MFAASRKLFRDKIANLNVSEVVLSCALSTIRCVNGDASNTRSATYRIANKASNNASATFRKLSKTGNNGLFSQEPISFILLLSQ